MRSTATTGEVNTDLAAETLIEISPADGGPRAILVPRDHTR